MKRYKERREHIADGDADMLKNGVRQRLGKSQPTSFPTVDHEMPSGVNIGFAPQKRPFLPKSSHPKCWSIAPSAVIAADRASLLSEHFPPVHSFWLSMRG